MALTINLDSQIVVKTAAQWAIDATVYSQKRILVTSDEYYGTTDQRKFKIADGVQTWSNLDYVPISETLAQVLANNNHTNNQDITSPNGKSVASILNGGLTLKHTSTNTPFLDMGDGYVNSYTSTGGYYVTEAAIAVNKYFQVASAKSSIVHNTQIDLNAPSVNLSQETASRIAIVDASKNIKSADTTTYPSLTELSYVKGVTSAIQTQIDKRRSLTITTGNQTTTSASATTITGLTASVDASSTYVFMGYLAVGCSTANGIRFTVTIPASATMDINFFGNTTSTSAVLTQRVTTSGTLTLTAHARRAATDSFVTIFGTVTVAGTSGNVVFQYGIATGGDTSTVYQEGTFINVTKI